MFGGRLYHVSRAACKCILGVSMPLPFEGCLLFEKLPLL